MIIDSRAAPKQKVDSRVVWQPWIALVAGSLLLLYWWVQGIRSGGGASALALLPFALPFVFVVRAALRPSPVTLALIGLALGIGTVASTGRGIVFLIVALAALAIELKLSRRRIGLVDAVAVLAGFAIPLIVVW